MVKGLMVALALSTLTLSGCTTFSRDGRGTDISPIATWCAFNRPRDYTRAQFATFSRKQRERFVTYQMKGERWCGWDSKKSGQTANVGT